MNFSQIRKQLLVWSVTVIFVALVIAALKIVEPLLRAYSINFFGDANMMQPIVGETFDSLVKFCKVLLWMLLVIALTRLFKAVVFDGALRSSNINAPTHLIQNIFSIIVYVVAFFIIFKSQYPTIDLAALFTTSAILGVILGLALQDTLGNLFAGISLQADRPFLIGDVINIQGKGSGIVENITWRGVKVRTFQNRLLIISNSILGREIIEVAPRDNLNARLINFTTHFDDAPMRTINLVTDSISEIDNVSQQMKPVVRIRDLGLNGIDWEAKYWLEDYAKFNDTDALVRKRIWYAFLRENITFAYTTQTIYVERAKKPDFHLANEIDETFARLSKIELFEPLSDDETRKLATSTKRRIFAPNELIIRAGDEGSTMFVINLGSVSVQIPKPNDNKESDEKITIATLHEGRFFGEMALLTGEPRSATVVALEETEVFEIGKDALKPLFELNPYLMEAISKSIVERRAAINAKVEIKAEAVAEETAGVFSSIKRFFGFN